VSDRNERFERGAEHFAGERLELLEDGATAWVLASGGRRLGTLRWDPRTDARWEAESRGARWAFEWSGRWPRRFHARDEAGNPVAWYVGGRLRRGGEILLADGRAAELRPAGRARRWRLHDDDGTRIAILTYGRRGPAAVLVDLDRAAVGHPVLTQVLLTACAVIRLDYNLGTPTTTDPFPLGGGS
jgi:hypothetical protein